MKKSFKYVQSIGLISILLLSLIIPVRATGHTIDTTPTDISFTGDYLVTKEGGYSYWMSAGVPFSYIIVDDQIAFCIEPHILVGTGEGYTQSYFTSDQQDLFTKIIFHGWDNTAQTGEDYVVTQMTLWRLISQIDPTTVITGIENVNVTNILSKMDQLILKANQHDLKPSFHNSSTTVNVNETAVFKDDNNMLNQAVIVDSNGFDANINGHTLSINTDSNSPDSGRILMRKYAAITQESAHAPLLYSHPFQQNIIVNQNPEPIYFWVDVDVLKQGQLIINKVNPKAQGIPNVSYLLSKYADMREPIGTFMTDDLGIIDLSLEQGTYYLQEISTPSPYLLDNTIQEVSVLANKTKNLKLSNETVLGQASIIKKGPNQEMIKNAVFEVLNSKNQVVETITTNNQGIAETSLLPLGNYQFVEKKVDAPYLLDPTPIPFELTYQDQYTPIVKVEKTHQNKSVTGEFILNKVDAENKSVKLSGTKFKLVHESSQEWQLVTDDQGLASLKNLPLGEYRLFEIEAAEGYLLDETVYTFKLDYESMNTQVVTHQKTFENKPIKGKIQIVKVDANHQEQPVEDAVFEIYKLPERTFVETIRSDQNGFAFSSDLRYGDYVIKEKEAPQEFYINPNEYYVQIRSNQKTEVQYIANDSVLLRLRLQKVDAQTNKPLENSVWEIINLETGEPMVFEYLNDHQEIVTQTQLITNQQGKAYTRGLLPYGKYSAREVVAPKGYIKSEEVEFTIDRNTQFIDLGTLGATTSLEVSNHPTTVEIRKLDVYGYFLPGASLVLMDEHEEIVTSFTSNDEAFVIKGLEVGQQYTLVEERPLEGYLLAQPVTFEVLETKENQVITLINERIPQLETTASFNTQIKESLPLEKAIVIDHVQTSNLWIGKEYTIKGKLLDVKTLEVVSESEKTFTADEENPIIEILFEFDASQLSNTTLVVFEELYKDNRLLQTHADLSDEKQMVSIPQLQTLATSRHNEKEMLPLVDSKVIDTISYFALTPHVQYTIKGKLVTKTGQAEVASSELVFTPTQANGTIELEYDFDARLYAGQSLVVFEELFNGEILIASHQDVFDQLQTVMIYQPSIQTKASVLERDVLEPEFVLIKDTVRYQDLVAHREYLLESSLINKKTHQPLVDEVIQTTFTPEHSEGFIDVIFKVHQDNLIKGEVVVFQTLKFQDEVLVVHHELDDLQQTIKFNEVTIKKVDRVDSTIRLKAAQFTLSSKGIQLSVKETDKDGIVRFIIENGTFTIEETKAPTGYQLSQNTIELENISDHVTITVPNQKIDELPETGTDHSLSLLLFGISMIGLGLKMVFFKKKER